MEPQEEARLTAQQWLRRHAFKLVSFAVLFFFGMRLLDAAMLWGVYQYFFEQFRGLGVASDHLAGAAAIAAMTVTVLLVRELIWKFILWRTTEGTLIFGGAVVVWMLVLYIMSIPGECEYFNPMSGSARFKYAQNDKGEVVFYPLGYRFNPKSGEQLEVFTPEAAKRLKEKMPACTPTSGKPAKPQARTAPQSAPPSPPPAPTAEYPAYNQYPQWAMAGEWYEQSFFGLGEKKMFSSPCLMMRLESLRWNPEVVILNLQVLNNCGVDRKLKRFRESNESYKIYLVADDSRSIRCVRDSLDPKDWPTIYPQESLRYQVWFPPLEPRPSAFTFYHWQFDPIRITLNF